MAYLSGRWEGFWEQDPWGRQFMHELELYFRANGDVEGQGYDIVGLFTIAGTWDQSTGQVVMRKHYLGKHDVLYTGYPDGEGCIAGTWEIEPACRGPFLLRPVLQCSGEHEPVEEWKPRR